MKEINLSGLDLKIYNETLENGLEIYLIPYENKNNYIITFATRFGSDILEFTDETDTTYKPPLGIAHFLEHKMFEQEDGIDPFTYFSKTGTDANASTTFDSTQYICYGTKNFKNNLKFLLNYVNSPYFTDENVEKEKGIIAEEIKMYDDMPDFQLEMKLRECIYKNSPRRIDIAGTVDEINKITKEDLYACYKNYYVPNNMFILIGGKFDIEEAKNAITETLDYKAKKQLPNIKNIKEPASIEKKKQTIFSNVEIPKIGFGLKVPVNNLKLKDLELNLYLQMLTTMLFGSSSEFKERVRNQKILNGMSMDWEIIKDYRTFYLMATTIEPDILIEEIKKELKNPTLSESTFERIKKVWIASEVKITDSVEATVNNIYYDIIKYHKIIPNRVERIRKMKFSKLQELWNTIDKDNISFVKMLKKED